MRTEIKTRKDMYQSEFYELYVDGKYYNSYIDKIEASIVEKKLLENYAKGKCS